MNQFTRASTDDRRREPEGLGVLEGTNFVDFIKRIGEGDTGAAPLEGVVVGMSSYPSPSPLEI